MVEDMTSPLTHALACKAFHTAIQKALKHARDGFPMLLQDLARSCNGASEKAVGLAPSGVDPILRDYMLIVQEHSLRSVFEKNVLDRLPRPHAITTEDLEEVAFQQLAGVTEESFSTAALRYLHLVLFSLQDRESDTPYSLDHWCTDDYLETDCGQPPATATIWRTSLSEGFELRRCTNGAKLCGNTTERAFEAANREFDRLLPSLNSSLSLLAEAVFHQRVRSDIEDEVDSQDEAGSQRWLRARPVIPASYGTRFVASCISAYFLRESKKTDSMDQRVRNAVNLLVIADSQESPAVALALCFSAIEALVCSKTEGITEELSRNVATLLQPASRDRIVAIKAIKALYGVRSKAMHGEKLLDDEKAWRQTRLLAAGVLAAVIEWQLYQSRTGNSTERSNFITELENAKTSGDRFVGPDERLAHCLP